MDILEQSVDNLYRHFRTEVSQTWGGLEYVEELEHWLSEQNLNNVMEYSGLLDNNDVATWEKAKALANDVKNTINNQIANYYKKQNQLFLQAIKNS